MATPSVKSTYSLDLETVKTLDELAAQWKVSKSEALRRAIRSASERHGEEPIGSLQALDALQGALKLSATRAAQWVTASESERRVASSRRSKGDK